MTSTRARPHSAELRGGPPERRLYAVGCVLLAVLPNADLLNFVLAETPLVVWKQVLSIVVTLVAIPVAARLGETAPGGSASAARRLLVALGSALAALTASSLIQGVSAARLAYALIAYGGFAAFLLFGHAALSLGRLPSVLRLLVVLGTFSGLGLLVDYLSPVFDFLPRSAALTFAEAAGGEFLRRAAFLFGASTTIFPFVALTVLASFLVLDHDPRRSVRLLALANLVVVPAGLAVTGSRAQLVLCAALFVCVLAGKAVYLRQAGFALLAAGILVAGGYWALDRWASSAQGDLLASRYSDQFAEDAEGNDARYANWRAGGELLLAPPGLDSVFGVGLGRSMGMIDDGEPPIPHYESSLFQAFAEGGVLALAVRYGPALVGLWFTLGPLLRGSFVAYLLFVWIALYCVSVTVAPTASAYHTQVAFFLAVMLSLAVRQVERALGVASPPLPRRARELLRREVV